MVPPILIGLGRLQEAYDFIKHRLLEQNEDGCDDEANFLEMKGEDISESLEIIDLNKCTDVGMTLDLALTKFLVHRAILRLQGGGEAGEENSEGSETISHLKIAKEWVRFDANLMLIKC